MLLDFAQFFFNFIIASFLFNYARVKLAGSDMERALAFIKG